MSLACCSLSVYGRVTQCVSVWLPALTTFNCIDVRCVSLSRSPLMEMEGFDRKEAPRPGE